MHGIRSFLLCERLWPAGRHNNGHGVRCMVWSGMASKKKRTCAGMVQVYGALFGYYERGGRDEGRES